MATPKKNKTLLKVNPVSSGHWSSGKSAEDIKQTKCVVQIVKACQLLASDAETGKSDSVCFMKFSPRVLDDVHPAPIDWDNFMSPTSGILSTSVIQACTDPIWNSYHTFPLILESYQELLNANIDLRIRDEDIEEDGSRSYDDLGQVSIPLKESIKIAKVAQRHSKNAFLGAPVWHTLDKCPGMRKKDGKILVSISIHFEDADTKMIQKEIGASSLTELMSRYKADASNTGEDANGFSATSATQIGRKKSTTALTPRVASPVRLFNDSAKTPLLELTIPEEKFPKGNTKRDIISDNHKQPAEVDTQDVKTLEAVQSEEMDVMAEVEALGTQINNSSENEKSGIDENDAQKSLEDEAARKAKADAQAKVLLDSAVQKATQAAGLEAARIIAEAKAEIAAAKEAAKQQRQIEDAVQEAKRQIERDTAQQVKQLQSEADATVATMKRNATEGQARKYDNHEGDLYWDENDQIAGGNKLNANNQDTEEPIPDRLLHSNSNEDIGGVQPTANDTNPPKENVALTPTKSERKSKIPKLIKSPSPSMPTTSVSAAEDISKSRSSDKKKRALSDKDRKQAEARSRIQKAKQDFKRKQAEEEANGTKSMEFIRLDDMNPTGGDEMLPPTAGGDKDFPPNDNDDDSVATTTVDDEELSPRRSASFPGQGNRPDTIRALREINSQREHMDRALAEMQRSSDEKFLTVQKQLSEFQNSRASFDRNPDGGREETFNDSHFTNNNKFVHDARSLHAATRRASSPEDARETISRVLHDGDADDIGMMLENFQAEYTEVLPMATLSRLFDCISTLLRRGKFKDPCLGWIVALTNTSTGENLVQNLPNYTCNALTEALVTASSEPSNRGVLAARLEAQLMDQLR
mmetsp:Transcript_24306/g.45225  ORF Transcript_24306/g.45225 Transcript_24306/m.45225 type:complete len:867 (+) Transcript_24306:132-2732(+)